MRIALSCNRAERTKHIHTRRSFRFSAERPKTLANETLAKRPANKKTTVTIKSFAPCKAIRIPESGKILLGESGILGLESGIQLKESAILLKIEIWVQNSSSSNEYWNPESKTVLDMLENKR